MNIEITDSPAESDETHVGVQVRAHNARFAKTDHKPLCVFIRSGDGTIIAGLTARTYWSYLDIIYLWVSEDHRKAGLATGLMAAAETEAIRRGCKH